MLKLQNGTAFLLTAFACTSLSFISFVFSFVCCITVLPAYSQSWSASGTTLYYNGGSVGIGTSNAGGYLLDVNGYIHSHLMFINDAPSSGAIGGWFRGATGGGSGNMVLQGNAGNGAAFWFSGTSVLKIGATGNTEPAVGALNITTTGQVGMGTTTPENMLEVATTSQLDGIKVSYNNTGLVRLHANSLFAGAYNLVVQNGDAGILFGTNGAQPNFGFVIAPWSPVQGGIRITGYGNVLIGKGTQTNTSYVLDVNGNVRANQVVVNTTGADYVFDPGYRMSSLKQLEAYVKKEHHLPGIAPAAQMQQDGLNLGDNQTRLLAKIEELTLYIIEQSRETQSLKDEQQQEMQTLKDKIKTLEERNRTLEDLEKRIEKLEHPDKTSATR